MFFRLKFKTKNSKLSKHLKHACSTAPQFDHRVHRSGSTDVFGDERQMEESGQDHADGRPPTVFVRFRCRTGVLAVAVRPFRVPSTDGRGNRMTHQRYRKRRGPGADQPIAVHDDDVAASVADFGRALRVVHRLPKNVHVSRAVRRAFQQKHRLMSRRQVVVVVVVVHSVARTVFFGNVFTTARETVSDGHYRAGYPRRFQKRPVVSAFNADY